jgi:hypothetical protein
MVISKGRASRTAIVTAEGNVNFKKVASFMPSLALKTTSQRQTVCKLQPHQPVLALDHAILSQHLPELCLIEGAPN